MYKVLISIWTKPSNNLSSKTDELSEDIIRNHLNFETRKFIHKFVNGKELNTSSYKYSDSLLSESKIL